MSEPRLLVVLLNYRTAEMTAKAADAAVVAMNGLPAEMTIVDNDSGDGSFEALTEHVAAQGWSHVRVVQSGWNGGFGAGNNVGMRGGMSDGTAPDFYFLLNSDAFPAPDAIRILYDHMVQSPETGCAGSHIHGPEGDPHLTAFRFPSILGELEGAARTGPVSRILAWWRVPLDELPMAPQTVDWLAGASMMLRRETLEEIGLFDETFFLYFEETDLCLRMARAGWQTWYIPQSKVSHVGGASTGMKSWSRVPQFWLDSRAHYFSKNHGWLYAVLATKAHVLGGLLWRLRRLVSGKPQLDPDHFLRDLAVHDLRSLWPWKRRPTEVRRLTDARSET